MTRRTVIGMVAGVTAGLVAGVGAVAFGAHAGGRHGIMKRMIVSAIDEALDEARVTPDQRTAIHGARDRVFATLEAQRATRRAHLEEALRLFEADAVDPARVEALHQQADAERERVRDTIHQALVEVHDVLTPAQRKALADYVRAHRLSHLH